MCHLIESSWQQFTGSISQPRLREVKFPQTVNGKVEIQTPIYLTPKLMLFPIHHSVGGKYCPNSIYAEVIWKCYFTNCYINTYKSSSWPKMVNCPFTTKSSTSTTTRSLVWGSILANRFQQLTPEECQLWKVALGYKWLCKPALRWSGRGSIWRVAGHG